MTTLTYNNYEFSMEYKGDFSSLYFNKHLKMAHILKIKCQAVS